MAARGKQTATLTVSAFGRYAVTAASSQGVALQLVDRLAGAGQVVGETGKEDGRLDLFLDRGEYRLVTYASPRGSGQATLAAHAFRELNERPPLLIEQRLEKESLGDFEQRSYWLEIKQKRIVALEAAGRHLADLRLWRDGTWLVEAVPSITQSQARPGQPLAVARLSAELEPGLYLLTAYGGAAQPWTESSDAKPFLLRYGIPELAPAVRERLTMSEFGVDRFLVPAGPTHFRLELPAAHAASLQVGNYDARNPFAATGGGASIDKRSVPPVAEVDQNASAQRVVTVTMEAGKPLILQHFEASSRYSFDGSGDYWISTIHAGHADDSVGATAVLTRQPRQGPEELVEQQAIDLAEAWHRRFNLLEPLTLFVRLPQPTAVGVVGEGVKARYRFEPFLTSRPRDYKTPPWEASGHRFPLLAGLYVLTVEPETKGILDLHLLPGLAGRSAGLTPVAGLVRFPSARLDSGWQYHLYLNRQPDVASGVVLRTLPIDLRLPLPVFQRAGEDLSIPVSVPEKGTLRARAEDGQGLEISLDNGASGSAIDVEPGRYRVTIRGGSAAKAYSLGVEPTRLASTTPLPPLPDSELAGLPKFPVLTPEAPHYLDLGRQSSETFKVAVDKPGLYQFETSGLLHTGGKVRTRVNPSLFTASRNGVGGNFLIQHYLREGDYQLSVATEGETRGHLGVELLRTDLGDGGELREGEVARAQLPIGSALAYRFKIARRGSYRLQAIGLGRNFDVRLEDGEGWPVGAPIQGGDLNVDLDAGSYRLLVMPQTAEARVLVRLDRIAEPRRFKGHGPHRIVLGTPIAHTWREPGKVGDARTPDQWEFFLRASAEVTIALDSEMEATLVSVADPKHPLASIDAKQPWRGDLGRGLYRLQARNSRKNNLVAYTLQITSTQLLAGQSRSVTAPAVIPVAVGSDALVEIASFGRGDVRARLVDAAGELVAQNDDRPGDWNFQIAQRLRPGQYRLFVDPIGQKRLQTAVSVNAPGEVEESPLQLGKDLEIRDGRVHVYPLAVPPDCNLLLASVRSSDAVGLALEGQGPQGWVSLGTRIGKDPFLALPVAERFAAYRLRTWSADRRSLRLSIRAVAANLPAQPESRWLQAAVLPQPVDDKRIDLRLAAIALSRPGTFRLSGDLRGLEWSDGGARAAQPSRDAVIAVSGTTLWLASEARGEQKAVPLGAERLRLPTGETDALRLELMAGQTASVDLEPNAAGPSLVLAQSRAGQPGAAVGEGRDPAAISFVAGEVAAVAFPGAGTNARLWNAADFATPLELDVRQVPLRAGSSLTLAPGVNEGVISARSALTAKLPGAAARIRLTLSPQTAAVFVKQGRPASTHWAGSEATQETVSTDADQLWLLNAAGSDGRYGAELTSDTGEVEPVLRPGELFERNVGTAGRLRVRAELPKAGDYRLRVRGKAEALWQEKGGRILSGNEFAIRDSGVLWLRHRPGTLVAWIDDPQDSDVVDRLPAGVPRTAVKPPQSVNLGGRQQVLAFTLDQPAMLQVRTGVPVITQFFVRGQPPATEAHLYGANLNLPAPAGATQLVIRALGSETLSGTANVTATQAVALQDGPGPEILLAPGGARLFAFALAQPATVGIGVRASSDVVRAVLYDERGAVQSEGVVQMPKLAAGRYLLAVEMPADSPPVRVRPIVLGLGKPDTRPPYEILRRYVEAPAEAGEALIYVPPQPAAPAVAGSSDEAADAEGAEGEEVAPKEEAEGERSESSEEAAGEETQ